MGSIRTVENIAKLVKLTVSTLQLPASRINIGAAQYNTATLTLNTAVTGVGGMDVAVAAGQLYYVYAVVSSGTVYLIASLNSSLPAGFTQARAVGGFTTNASSQIDQVGEYPGNLAVAGSVSAGSFSTQPLINGFINGTLDVWQRGTSFAAISSGTYTADKVQYQKTGTMVHTVDRQTDAPTNMQTGYFLSYSLRALCTTAQGSLGAGDYSVLTSRIEGYDYQKFYGRPFRIQFWVKSSKAGVMTVSLRNGANDRSYISPVTINGTNTWEKKTIDIAPDTGGTWYFDERIGAAISFSLAVGSTYQTSSTNQWLSGVYFATPNQTNFVDAINNDVRVAAVQMIPGKFSSSIDMPFQRCANTFAEEMAICRRYCFQTGQMYLLGQTYPTGGQSYFSVATTLRTVVPTIKLNASCYLFDGTGEGALTGETYTAASMIDGVYRFVVDRSRGATNWAPIGLTINAVLSSDL